MALPMQFTTAYFCVEENPQEALVHAMNQAGKQGFMLVSCHYAVTSYEGDDGELIYKHHMVLLFAKQAGPQLLVPNKAIQ